jgi:hypothetical protein
MERKRQLELKFNLLETNKDNGAFFQLHYFENKEKSFRVEVEVCHILRFEENQRQEG